MVPMCGAGGRIPHHCFGLARRGGGSRRFRPVPRSLHFHVVDVDAPFISETGFRSLYFVRSHFDMALACAGQNVEDVARAAFAGYLAKERRPLAPEYRQRRADEPAPPAPSFAEMSYEETGGQMAFGF